MSEREGWMPDTERLCMAFDLCDQAWDEIGDGEREPNDSWLDPLRAVVREAVEKALAEQALALEASEKAHDVVRDICARAGVHHPEVILRQRDEARKQLAEQEARHKREVLNAQVSSLVRIEALLASRRGTALQVVRDAIDALRAELAALDKGGE